MAYKRPLNKTQIAILILLWIIGVSYILLYAKIDIFTIFALVFASFFILYPVIKSIKEKKE